jgi:hypothetical protein
MTSEIRRPATTVVPGFVCGRVWLRERGWAAGLGARTAVVVEVVAGVWVVVV